MDKRIEQAIKDFNQAQKESKKAAEKVAAIEQQYTDYANSFFKAGKWKEATEEQKQQLKKYDSAVSEAKKEQKITALVYKAASQNIADMAANILKAAVLNNPEKFNYPVHYKKFKTSVESILPAEYFYYDSSEYSFYIYFRTGIYNHKQCFVFDKNSDGTINTSRTTVKEINVTLADIKREAKAAFKYAEKLKSAYKKLQDESDNAKKNFVSAIKYEIPYVSISSGLMNTDNF